jgi:L-asparagine transporter-like permease
MTASSTEKTYKIQLTCATISLIATIILYATLIIQLTIHNTENTSTITYTTPLMFTAITTLLLIMSWQTKKQLQNQQQNNK